MVESAGAGCSERANRWTDGDGERLQVTQEVKDEGLTIGTDSTRETVSRLPFATCPADPSWRP